MKKLWIIFGMLILLMGVNGIDKKELKRQCRIDCAAAYKQSVKICNIPSYGLCEAECKQGNKTCLKQYNECLSNKRSIKKECIIGFSINKEICFKSCRQFECSDIYKPICGIDGLTYSNECLLRLAEVRKRHDGQCESFCNDTDGRDDKIKGRAYGHVLNFDNKSTDLKYFDDECIDFSLNQHGQIVSECSTTEKCKIKEFFCNDNLILYDYIDCPYGCLNGACLRNSEQAAPNSSQIYEFMEGETKMISVNNVEYEVTNTIITDTGDLYAKFVVNGKVSGKLRKNEIFKFSEEGSLRVINISPDEVGDLTSDKVSIVFESGN